ncbi:hypothetical protein [Gloeothece verrucosa]|uniref:WD40 repeat domain-containing protein n=1 Tax=Gloeothece verrucosa TaxID=2546359 RepID=UPI0012FEF29D
MTKVEFNPDSSFALIATAYSDNNQIKLWDYKGRQIAQFEGDWKETVSISFTPEGKYLFAAGDNGIIQQWNVGEINLNTLLTNGCNWLDFYSTTHPTEYKKVGQGCGKIKTSVSKS